jgi:hypothetical protein
MGHRTRFRTRDFPFGQVRASDQGVLNLGVVNQVQRPEPQVITSGGRDVDVPLDLPKLYRKRPGIAQDDTQAAECVVKFAESV